MDRTHVVRAWRVVTAALVTVVLVGSCAGESTVDPPTAPGAAASAGATASGATASGGAHGKHAAPPPAAALRTGERFVNLSMPRPYAPTAPNGGTDEYRCFLVDPKVGGESYLTGSQFLPQNGDLVHHAIFFRIDAATVAAARSRDDSTPGDGWTCFGDTGLGGDSSADWVGHWAPGANETLLRPGIGYPMPAGSQLVMQVHYNLLGSGGRPGGTDQSAIRLRVTDGTTKLAPLQTSLLQAPVELPCAEAESGPLCARDAAVRDVTKRFGPDAGRLVAGLNEYCNAGRPPVPGSTQRCDQQMRGGGTVYAVAGHMHLLGRAIKVELNPGTPGARTLLDIPQYNFDEQSIRPLATPVKIKAGDTLRLTCTHDAGLRRRLPELQPLPPRYVVWGDGTSDEMCLGILLTVRS